MAARRFVPIKLTEEDRLQKAIFDHYRMRGAPGAVMCAIPNGGQRSFTTGARLKLTGVRAGIPDLLCIVRGQVFFVELKKPGGRLSKEQRERREELQAAGVHVHVIDNVDDAVTLLEKRGVLKGNSAVRQPVMMVS